MGRNHLLEKDLGVNINNKLDGNSLEELKQSGLPQKKDGIKSI